MAFYVPIFLLFYALFNPSLSQAQAQVQQNEQNMKKSEQVGQAFSVLVMGDSLSAAYGIDAKDGWVALLDKGYANLQVINASISGETTSGGKQRLTALMAQYQPDILVLELGANDALRGQDLNISKQNLQQMIDQCHVLQKGCQVILLGVQLPTNYGPAYDLLFQKMYRDLADKNTALFDPFFLEPVALEPGMMQDDALHPTAEAQPLILQRLQPLFDQAIDKLEQ